jgi:hypothetical protein
MDNNFSTQAKEIISYSREVVSYNGFYRHRAFILGLIRDGENTAVKIF